MPGRLSLWSENLKPRPCNIFLAFGSNDSILTAFNCSLTLSNLCKISSVLSAVSKLKDTKLIFTYPNSDTFGRIIINMIKKFVSSKKNDSVKFSSLGYVNYLSILQYVDCVLGNSSSGLLEAPSLKIPTINIGDRQEGRLKAKSIIDSKPVKSLITKSIKKVYSTKFQMNLKYTRNAYEYKDSSNKIYKIIKKSIVPKELKKIFYNIWKIC